jgi:hypothetical protein
MESKNLINKRKYVNSERKFHSSAFKQLYFIKNKEGYWIRLYKWIAKEVKYIAAVCYQIKWKIWFVVTFKNRWK